MGNRYFLYLSYKGSNYCGWQKQPNALSVQQVVEDKLSIALQQPIKIIGCGRTDAGVHAINYVAHFDSPKITNSDFSYKLNSLLPDDIVVHECKLVHNDAHARFNAISRSYTYKIHTERSPFKKNLSLYYPWRENINIKKFQEINSLLEDTTSFETFCKTHSGNDHFLCNITKIDWIKVEPGVFEFTITANRFLRGMIRLLVGMYLNYGKGKLTIQEIKQAIETKNILEPNWSVPPDGLYLQNIEYPESIFLDK